MASMAFAQQSTAPSTDWQQQIRACTAKNDFSGALAIADSRLSAAPQDLEARAWRGRILGWLGRWQESEQEFRQVLEKAPNDTDVLLGLAGALNAQQRNEEALTILNQAIALDPKRADLHAARGRALRALNRRDEARAAFRDALALAPDDAEAKQGLDSVREEPRHQFVIGSDFDQFNYTSLDAQAYSFSLRSSLNARFTSLVAARFDHRAGIYAGRWTGALTTRLSRRDAFTFGGSVGRDNGIVSKSEAFFEYGRGFSFGERNLVRGFETSFQQKWLWFDSARILTLTPSVLFYFPKEWTWSLAVTSARSRFPGTNAEWRASGVTRLTFPLVRRVAGNLFFAVGTENFALADQIGRFSAQTYGGGLRVQITSRQDISGYVAYQNRTQGRRQMSFGFAYGIRF